MCTWGSSEFEAMRLAEEEYDLIFQEMVVTRKNVTILRELKADQGLVGYHIRVWYEQQPRKEDDNEG